jgi:TrpR-related protein YerC/YecD
MVRKGKTGDAQKNAGCSLEAAFLKLKNENEVRAFLTDLCTPAEFQAMQERWKVCQLLKTQVLSYQEIHEQTNVSITTIGRVARFLFNESNRGYETVLERLQHSPKIHRHLSRA